MQTNTIWYQQTRQRNGTIIRKQEISTLGTLSRRQSSTRNRVPTTIPTDSPRTQDETWPINIDFVRSHLGSLMDDLMPELIETFFEDGIIRLGQLQTSLSGHDEQQIWQTAHSLKGSSATLGMLSFSSLCLQLETVAKGKDWENIPKLVGQVDTEFNKIQAVLTI